MLKRDTIKRVTKRIIFILFSFLCLVIAVDIVLRIFFFIKDGYEAKKQFLGAQDEVYHYVYRDNPSWVTDYLQEDKALKYQYYPFFEWRHEEFNGRCITISKEGIRKTWNPDFQNMQERKRVFCLGGSVIWGAASRDDFTIPSFLSKILNKHGSAYEVVNYGEISYTLTQEVVYLLMRLKQGDIPDIVIFLDGVNDVFSAFDAKEAGMIVNLNSFRHKVFKEEISDTKMFLRGLSAVIEDYSGLIRVIKLIRDNYFSRNKNITKGNSCQSDENKTMDLAEAVAQDYRRNILFIDRLSKLYGFKYAFFLQPSLPTTKNKTKEELSYNSMKNEPLNKMYQLAYKRIKEVNKGLAHFYDISDIFDSKSKTMYIDICHCGEEGNAMIADKIFGLIKDDL